jgi:hypothetical protein
VWTGNLAEDDLEVVWREPQPLQVTVMYSLLSTRITICPWVFHQHGRRIRDFRWFWEKACRRAGCPGRLLHERSAAHKLDEAAA